VNRARSRRRRRAAHGRGHGVGARRAGHACEVCTSGAAALVALRRARRRRRRERLEDAAQDGLALMKAIHERRPGLPVILVTAHGSVRRRSPRCAKARFDYLTKPFDNDELLALVAAPSTSRASNARTASCAGGPHALRPRYDRRRERAEPGHARLRTPGAPSRAAVLVQGESGTGRSWSPASSILDDRVGNPFVAVNMKAFARA